MGLWWGEWPIMQLCCLLSLWSLGWRERADTLIKKGKPLVFFVCVLGTIWLSGLPVMACLIVCVVSMGWVTHCVIVLSVVNVIPRFGGSGQTHRKSLGIQSFVYHSMFERLVAAVTWDTGLGRWLRSDDHTTDVGNPWHLSDAKGILWAHSKLMRASTFSVQIE